MTALPAMSVPMPHHDETEAVTQSGMHLLSGLRIAVLTDDIGRAMQLEAELLRHHSDVYIGRSIADLQAAQSADVQAILIDSALPDKASDEQAIREDARLRWAKMQRFHWNALWPDHRETPDLLALAGMVVSVVQPEREFRQMLKEESALMVELAWLGPGRILRCVREDGSWRIIYASDTAEVTIEVHDGEVIRAAWDEFGPPSARLEGPRAIEGFVALQRGRVRVERPGADPREAIRTLRKRRVASGPFPKVEAGHGRSSDREETRPKAPSPELLAGEEPKSKLAEGDATIVGAKVPDEVAAAKARRQPSTGVRPTEQARVPRSVESYRDTEVSPPHVPRPTLPLGASALPAMPKRIRRGVLSAPVDVVERNSAPGSRTSKSQASESPESRAAASASRPSASEDESRASEPALESGAAETKAVQSRIVGSSATTPQEENAAEVPSSPSLPVSAERAEPVDQDAEVPSTGVPSSAPASTAGEEPLEASALDSLDVGETVLDLRPYISPAHLADASETPDSESAPAASDDLRTTAPMDAGPIETALRMADQPVVQLPAPIPSMPPPNLPNLPDLPNSSELLSRVGSPSTKTASTKAASTKAASTKTAKAFPAPVPSLPAEVSPATAEVPTSSATSSGSRPAPSAAASASPSASAVDRQDPAKAPIQRVAVPIVDAEPVDEPSLPAKEPLIGEPTRPEGWIVPKPSLDPALLVPETAPRRPAFGPDSELEEKLKGAESPDDDEYYDGTSSTEDPPPPPPDLVSAEWTPIVTRGPVEAPAKKKKSTTVWVWVTAVILFLLGIAGGTAAVLIFLR
ncbi:MAG: hypothetical protein AAGF12_17905 [Myxococcota bacterium]